MIVKVLAQVERQQKPWALQTAFVQRKLRIKTTKKKRREKERKEIDMLCTHTRREKTSASGVSSNAIEPKQDNE